MALFKKKTPELPGNERDPLEIEELKKIIAETRETESHDVQELRTDMTVLNKEIKTAEDLISTSHLEKIQKEINDLKIMGQLSIENREETELLNKKVDNLIKLVDELKVQYVVAAENDPSEEIQNLKSEIRKVKEQSIRILNT